MAGMAWYMVWPGEVWHDILYGLADMAWYMIRPGKVCGNDYVFYGIVLAMVPFICGEANVSWRSCSHVQDPFISRGTVTCMFRSHVKLLFTLGGSKLRDCEYISLFWDRALDSHSYCVLSVDQVFCESLYL